MASDKSMYLVAAVVLTLGIGIRYGHGNNPKELAACAFQRTSEILHRVNDRSSTQGERSVMALSDRQTCANDRAVPAVARAQARVEEAIARREATSARVQAALARIDNRVMRIEINDDSE